MKMKSSTHTLKSVFLCVFAAIMAISFGIVLTHSATALKANAEEENETYAASGWTEYGGKSVSESAGGVVMTCGAEGYSFSNTTKKAYKTDNLAISFRLRDYVFDPSGAASNYFIGLTANDEDFAAEDGSSYGVALISNTDGYTFNAWFVQRDKEATAIPGYNHLALVGGSNVKLTSTGVMTITFHVEGNGQWYIWLNGIYQIEVPADCNAALSAQTRSHVAFVATDNFGALSAQTAKLEVISIASDVLGLLNENTNINNRVPDTEYDVTENGVTFSTANMADGTNIAANVSDSLVGKLDGAVISIRNDFRNIGSYNIDLGFGTTHGAGRFTFWDSYSDLPEVVGNIGLRIASNNTLIFLLIARSATEGYEEVVRVGLYGAATPIPMNDDNEYVIQFLKVDGVWRVVINGRWMYSNETPASGDFHAYFNTVMESVNNAAGESVSPWIMMGDTVGKTEGFSAAITVKGYGTQRWGKVVDPNEGVMGDSITGTLEFNKNEWTSITPDGTSVDVKITDGGFVLDGKNTVSGFNVGMNYKSPIADLNGYAVTVALPEKILQSGGAVKGWYGMFIGDVTNSNFADMNSVFIRWRYENSDSPASDAAGDLIVWEKGVGPVSSCAIAFPAKTERTGEVTVRFVLDEKSGDYRVYINGARVAAPAVEAAMTDHLNGMSVKYLTVNATYEIDNLGSAWDENDDGMQEITVVSVGGKKIVNNVPETVNASIDLEATATHDSVTLTWSKAVYPTGYMDSYNFTPAGYVIERYNLTDEGPEATIAVEGGVDVLTYTDTGLDANTRYFYNVYATDDRDNRLMASSRKAVNTTEAPAESSDSGDSGDPTDSEDGSSSEVGDSSSEDGASSSAKKGCLGSVSASSMMFGVAALSFVALARKRRQR